MSSSGRRGTSHRWGTDEHRSDTVTCGLTRCCGPVFPASSFEAGLLICVHPCPICGSFQLWRTKWRCSVSTTAHVRILAVGFEPRRHEETKVGQVGNGCPWRSTASSDLRGFVASCLRGENLPAGRRRCAVVLVLQRTFAVGRTILHHEDTKARRSDKSVDCTVACPSDPSDLRPFAPSWLESDRRKSKVRCSGRIGAEVTSRVRMPSSRRLRYAEDPDRSPCDPGLRRTSDAGVAPPTWNRDVNPAALLNPCASRGAPDVHPGLLSDGTDAHGLNQIRIRWRRACTQ